MEWMHVLHASAGAEEVGFWSLCLRRCCCCCYCRNTILIDKYPSGIHTLRATTRCGGEGGGQMLAVNTVNPAQAYHSCADPVDLICRGEPGADSRAGRADGRGPAALIIPETLQPGRADELSEKLREGQGCLP